VFKGHLDALLLATVEPGLRYGLGVAEALRVGSGGRVVLASGTLYPALHRLERAGLLVGGWSDAEGRPRRSYELTPAGHAAVAEQRLAVAGFRGDRHRSARPRRVAVGTATSRHTRTAMTG
jgi:DNA-binding PadR family transcriptional regulator